MDLDDIPVKRIGLLFAVFLALSFWAGAMFGMNQGRETGYELGYQNGTEQGRLNAFQDLETSEPVFIYRQEVNMNRSIAVAYPGLNMSYACHVYGMTESKTGDWTYMYENGTRCRFVSADLSEKWNDPAFEDKYLRDQVQDSNVSGSNATAEQ